MIFTEIRVPLESIGVKIAPWPSPSIERVGGELYEPPVLLTKTSTICPFTTGNSTSKG